MNVKAANVQRKTVKTLSKPGEPLIKATLKMTGMSGSLETEYKETKARHSVTAAVVIAFGGVLLEYVVSLTKK